MRLIDGVKWYTSREIEELISVTKATVSSYMRRHKIEVKKIFTQVKGGHGSTKRQKVNYFPESSISGIRDWFIPPEDNSEIKIDIGNKTIRMLSMLNVARFLNFPETEIKDIIKNGEIPNTDLAGEVCFFENDIKAYMESRVYEKRLLKITAERNRQKRISKEIPETFTPVDIPIMQKRLEEMLTNLQKDLNRIMLELGI